MTPEQKEAYEAGMRAGLEKAAAWHHDQAEAYRIDGGHITNGSLFASEHRVSARHLRALASSQPAPAADAGQVEAWTDDAERWGSALNEASWKFTEVCPEKSSMLFNHCKPALREAILTYAAAVRKAHPSLLDAERVREDERDRLMSEAIFPCEFGPGAINEEVWLWLKRFAGAMIPETRAALRQKEGKA